MILSSPERIFSVLRISLLYCFLISVSLTQLQQKSLCSRFRRQNEQQYRSPRLPPFCSASIREGRVALSVGHPRGTHSRYVIGCCLIPLEICGVKNNSRRITYGIGCVWGMPSLSPLSSLGFQPRLIVPSTSAIGTAGSVMTIGLSINGCSHQKISLTRENKIDQSKSGLVVELAL